MEGRALANMSASQQQAHLSAACSKGFIVSDAHLPEDFLTGYGIHYITVVPRVPRKDSPLKHSAGQRAHWPPGWGRLTSM